MKVRTKLTKFYCGTALSICKLERPQSSMRNSHASNNVSGVSKAIIIINNNNNHNHNHNHNHNNNNNYNHNHNNNNNDKERKPVPEQKPALKKKTRGLD